MNNITMLIDIERCASTTGATFERLNLLEVDDDLIRGADFSLTSASPMNGLLSARSALLPSVGQIVVGGNNVKFPGSSEDLSQFGSGLLIN